MLHLLITLEIKYLVFIFLLSEELDMKNLLSPRMQILYLTSQ